MFTNPFSGKALERKLTNEELIRAMREMIATELEATNLYQALADSIEDKAAAKILRDVADEEIIHVGEFQKVLYTLTEKEKELVNKGIAEAEEKLKEKTSDSEEDSEKEKPEEKKIADKKPLRRLSLR